MGVEQTLLAADYSALEIGIAGDLHLRLFGDDQTAKAYKAQFDKTNPVDIHSNNAREVFGTWLKWKVPAGMEYAGQLVSAIPVAQFKKHPYGALLRDMIKAVFYGLAYGKSAYGFSTLLGPDGKMIGEDRAGEMVDALLNAVPGMRRWFTWAEEFVRANHGIYSLGGRWCDLSVEMDTDDEWLHRRAFRRAYNFPMQATGADIIGDAMVRIMRCKYMRKTGFRLCANIHDELLVRGPLANVAEAQSLLTKHMREATANGTPLLVQIETTSNYGPTYADAK